MVLLWMPALLQGCTRPFQRNDCEIFEILARHFQAAQTDASKSQEDLLAQV